MLFLLISLCASCHKENREKALKTFEAFENLYQESICFSCRLHLEYYAFRKNSWVLFARLFYYNQSLFEKVGMVWLPLHMLYDFVLVHVTYSWNFERFLLP